MELSINEKEKQWLADLFEQMALNDHIDIPRFAQSNCFLTLAEKISD
ncbi:hypothetical protein M3M35_07125 [Fructilactobacillus myrtifloralis]|uniref:Uncharacterized protein n=1 Tax=Fructilactobacillus myrtifloralis TaxID=2940301 RepID=A0ABY5BNJ7_9LACO|nr:hypothetical protein [Fructilactobacillus myrtifloralis]USS85054.1 hypothetical protein M3M35_07125 [Fructilactobacillus myrtifloralis]